MTAQPAGELPGPPSSDRETFRPLLPDASTAASASGFRWAGALLAVGCAVLFFGELLYLPLGPILGLPSSEATYADALSTALRLEPLMRWAGSAASIGDAAIFAACIALMRRQKIPAYGDLEGVSWLLVGVGFAIAIVFDSLMGTVLGSVAHLQQPDSFRAFKGWFDFLFAVGNVFVIGAVALFWIDARSSSPLLPKVVDYAFALISGMAAAAGLAYVLGWSVVPFLIGGTIILTTLGLGILGVQIARHEA